MHWRGEGLRTLADLHHRLLVLSLGSLVHGYSTADVGIDGGASKPRTAATQRRGVLTAFTRREEGESLALANLHSWELIRDVDGRMPRRGGPLAAARRNVVGGEDLCALHVVHAVFGDLGDACEDRVVGWCLFAGVGAAWRNEVDAHRPHRHAREEKHGRFPIASGGPHGAVVDARLLRRRDLGVCDRPRGAKRDFRHTTRERQHSGHRGDALCAHATITGQRHAGSQLFQRSDTARTQGNATTQLYCLSIITCTGGASQEACPAEVRGHR